MQRIMSGWRSFYKRFIVLNDPTPDTARRGTVLSAILLVLLLSSVFMLLTVVLLNIQAPNQTLILVTPAVLAFLYFITRQGYVSLVSWITVLFIGAFSFNFSPTAITLSTISLIGFALFILVAGFLLSLRWMAAAVGLVAFSCLNFDFYLSQADATIRLSLPVVAAYVGLGGLIALFLNQWQTALEEATNANDELRTARDQLELQVRRRTNELQQSFDLTSQVGFIVAQSNSLPILLQRAIELIQNNFNFYHVHIYTYKPGSQELVMARGSGDVGRKLLEMKHTIEYGKGMVGTAARYKQIVLENNVDRDPNFIRNPLLPDTQSEMAIPLLVGDTVLGVLDIQENRWSAFNEATQKLMQNLANQLAVAIRNFRLVEESTAALERIENLNRRLTRENWSRTLESTAVSGYAYAPDQTYPTTSDWLPSMRRILAQNTQDPPPTPSDTAQTDGPRSNDFAIPLILRGEMLGVLGLERPLDVPWTEDDELVIQNLAEQITLALESARLLEDTQRNAWRDQVVSETTAQVWSSADVQDVLRSAVAQLADKLDASEVVIRLGTEKDLTSST